MRKTVLFTQVLTPSLPADSGIHAPSSKVPKGWHRRKLSGWITAHLVPEGFRKNIEKKLGNFVIIRSVNRQIHTHTRLPNRVDV